ncbi:hypothetical protein PV327_011679 [Microctonus hyperodae]|uniref:Uncharacterized protein n=1 Tax=Microctonus hyperodae TaxID=165561 RepID=A0AA39FGZ1_MICHY|nr:hypothetical protein PV327_011679 [Microctonus hyperodae]
MDYMPSNEDNDYSGIFGCICSPVVVWSVRNKFEEQAAILLLESETGAMKTRLTCYLIIIMEFSENYRKEKFSQSMDVEKRRKNTKSDLEASADCSQRILENHTGINN